MSKLHEVLAVEGDLEGIYKKILEETKVTFTKKADHFFGHLKKLEMFNEDAKNEEMEDHKEMVTTVKEKLDYAAGPIIRYFDAVLQKEKTNQRATEDLVVDDITIATGVPATFLLGLETKLKHVRAMYEAIPTLPPGNTWEEAEDLGSGVFKLKHPDEKLKTAKTFMHKVLYEATDKHPAQIEKWEEQRPVGRYTTDTWTGMLSPAEKSILLGRIDKLLQSVKKARQRANTAKVVESTIGKEIFDYINGSAS
jgi:hypothetical protein